MKIKEEGKRIVQTDLADKSLQLPRRKEETGSKVTVLQLTNAEQSPFLHSRRCAKKHLCFLCLTLENRSTLNRLQVETFRL